MATSTPSVSAADRTGYVDELVGRPGWFDRGLLLLPAVVAVPIAVGFAATILNLIATRYPADGDSAAIDAQALWLGLPLAQDPDVGYSAIGYTPLLTFISAALNHISLWRGWPMLLNAVALIAFVWLVAWVARRPDARGAEIDRILGALASAGVGLVGYWALSSPQEAFLFLDRPEAVAWVPALAGLVLVAPAIKGSKRATVASIALLTVGFWMKQTTLAVSACAVLWLVVSAFGGAIAWRRVAVFAGSLLVINVAAIAAYGTLTDGWGTFFSFVQATQQPCCELSTEKLEYFRLYTREFLTKGALPVLFALVLAVPAIVAGARRWRPLHKWRSTSWRQRAAGLSVEGHMLALLSVYLPVGYLAAGFARANHGSAINQTFGVMCALILLGALAWRFAGRHPVTRAAASAAFVTPVLAVLLIGSKTFVVSEHDLYLPPLAETREFAEIPPALVELGRRAVVYHPDHPDLSVASQGVIYPGWINLAAYTGVGSSSGYFTRALNQRRFDVVFPFTEGQRTHALASGGGVFDHGFFWRANRVMELKYAPANDGTEGLRRRPGPDPAPWTARCFGPWRLAGERWAPHVGGGFWCPSGGDGIRLRESMTPDFADIQTLDLVKSISGSASIRLGSPLGFAELRLGSQRSPALQLQITSDASMIAITAVTHDGQTVKVRVPRVDGPDLLRLQFAPAANGRLELTAGSGGAVVARVPEFEPQRLAVGSNPGGDVSFDLSELRLGVEPQWFWHP